MKISVIIPCSRPDRLGPLCKRLMLQERHDFEMDIVVVSPAESEAALKGLPCSIILVDRLYPPGRMRNIGAAAADGDVLAFIDDDCIPPPDWLKTMLPTLMAVPDRAVVGCRIASWQSGFWNHCADVALFWSYLGFKGADANLGSAALLVRREPYVAAGGFDETLLASEDWDFSLRVRNRGWHCWFDPAVTVFHDHGRGRFGAILRQSLASGRRSDLVVQKRHIEQATIVGRLSVRCGTSKRYPWVILPLALINTVMQIGPQLMHRPVVLCYSPFVLLARLAYHIGVWQCLREQEAAGQ